MDASSIWPALLLTLLAGLATAIGSAIAFFAPRADTRFLGISLGFSAGVMIYVSFVELLPSGVDALEEISRSAHTTAVVALFVGMLLVAVIDRSVPLGYNPHEMRPRDRLDSPGSQGPPSSAANVEASGSAETDTRGKEAVGAEPLMKVGLLTAAVITLHNLPEGLATLLTSMQDIHLGMPVALAVGIHNIPEGIAVSVPVYYATGSRWQAFGWSALSGLSEPVGALLGLLLLSSFWSQALLGLSLAAVAGIMIFISFDVLLPSAETYGEHHPTVYALVAGMAVMALSLLLL
ncbi:Zinc transporter ZupT [Thiorhodovibrio winogradskyi]|uniref:Zinc transporter ZupT n=1 Tax=Thiorhodovibrio winogradskyi TaxID=77007 RepID=A0ABZ0SDU7_9GAMM|nr:zinc transporter ZupT [Thiorhodovibrio winogradskyi]